MTLSPLGDSRAAFEALEVVANHLIAKASPLRFKVAETTSEREAAFRLRYRALIERGNAAPDDFPEGLECDSYDERAIQVIGVDESGRAISTGRIVLPEAGKLLPTEEAFELTVEPCGMVVEVGRYTASRELAGRDGRPSLGILGFCWLETRSRGYSIACGVASSAMLRHYRRIGFVVHELAPPRIHYGEERYPFRFDLVASAQALFGSWGPGS
jgi:N-acyl-L-homoserine lactone synthetase